jgi:hypothetical protein
MGKAEADTEADTEAETAETETARYLPRVQKIQHLSFHHPTPPK